MTKEEKINACIEIVKKSMPLSENQEAQLRMTLNHEPLDFKNMHFIIPRQSGRTRFRAEMYRAISELQNKPAL